MIVSSTSVQAQKRAGTQKIGILMAMEKELKMREITGLFPTARAVDMESYHLDGKKVKRPSKGIYVIGKRKYLIK